VVDDETDVDVLDDVAILNENSGLSLVEVAGSEVEMSCDDQVVVGIEENDCDVVEGVDTDVSKEVDIVVDCETLSNVGVDVNGFPTSESPVAGLTLSEACPEIADCSSWAS
jgi:hypothetical protein